MLLRYSGCRPLRFTLPGQSQKPFVLRNMEQDGLWPVAEHDHEATRVPGAKPFHQRAKAAGGVTCGNDLIDSESWHGSLLVGMYTAG